LATHRHRQHQQKKDWAEKAKPRSEPGTPRENHLVRTEAQE
jgi:hypothetical protein